MSCSFPQGAHPYDTLLDDYEPVLTTVDIQAIFKVLRPAQVAPLHAIAGKPRIDDAVLPLYAASEFWSSRGSGHRVRVRLDTRPADKSTHRLRRPSRRTTCASRRASWSATRSRFVRHAPRDRARALCVDRVHRRTRSRRCVARCTSRRAGCGKPRTLAPVLEHFVQFVSLQGQLKSVSSERLIAPPKVPPHPRRNTEATYNPAHHDARRAERSRS